MRILILFSQPWKVGGAETHVLDLLKVLRAHGHQAYIATNGTDDAPVQPLEGLTECQWKWNFRSANPLEFRRIARKLRGIVDEYRIDLIHAHQRTAGYFAAFAKRQTGVPFVVTVHDPWKRAPLKKLHARLFSDIITVSDDLKRQFIENFGFAERQVHTIWNAVDQTRYQSRLVSAEKKAALRQELGIEPDDQVVSLIARIYRSKGHQYLIQAAPAILREVPQAKFLFVGTGEHEAMFREEIHKAGLDASFIFAGYREDIPEIIAISEIVVRPSDMEGLPINLIEAMFMEKPVIATRIAGVPEMIEQGRNGYMIAPKDAQALARYSVTLLKDKALCEKMGREGKKIATERFTLEAFWHKLERLYRCLLEGSAHG